jgi:putative transposase
MPNYHRNHVPGATYAFTVNLRDRRSDLLTTQIDHLRAAVHSVRAEHPFTIEAWVVLPDHMHCLWTLPPGDTLYPRRLQLIKGRFSQTQPSTQIPRASLIRKAERGIWQRRYWEHTIRDDADFAAHMDYIHFNPVKHGYAHSAADWPYSTFARCVARGLYPVDWTASDVEPTEAGERR